MLPVSSRRIPTRLSCNQFQVAKTAITLLLTAFCLLAPMAYSVDDPTETQPSAAPSTETETVNIDSNQQTASAETSQQKSAADAPAEQLTITETTQQPDADEAPAEQTDSTGTKQQSDTNESSASEQTTQSQTDSTAAKPKPGADKTSAKPPATAKDNQPAVEPDHPGKTTETKSNQQAGNTGTQQASPGEQQTAEQQTAEQPTAEQQAAQQQKELGSKKSLDTVLDEIERKNSLIDELIKAQKKLSAMEDDSIQLRVLQYQLDVMRLYDRATDLVLTLNKNDKDTPTYYRRLKKEMLPIGPYIRRAIIQKSSESPPEGIEPISSDGIRFFEDKNRFINDAISALSEHVHNLNRLGFSSTESTAYLHQELRRRAETLSGEIQIINQHQKELQHSLSSSAGDDSSNNKQYLLNVKMDSLIKSMRLTVNLLEANNLDAQQYKTLLIASTGRITREILEPSVFTGVVKSWFNDVKTDLSNTGADKLFNILFFILILLLFYVLSKVLTKIFAVSMSKSTFNTSQLMEGMINTLVFRLTMLIGFLVGLSQFGVSIAPILAGLGIAGFIVGFALQDVLANFAAGVMIIVYRPYDVGDMIEVSGGFGKVKSMNLVSTTLLTIDNQSLIIPNSKIWGDVIKNVTAQAVRRVDMVFGISYGDSIAKAEAVLMDILESCEAVLKKPEPMIKVHTLNNSSVDFVVRPWVKTDDYWDVYWYVTRTVKERFDEEGISIPFPQRDVHLFQVGQEAPAEEEKEAPAEQKEHAVKREANE